jgi:hypothetical protein
VLLFAACIYFGCYRKKKVKAPLLLELSENLSAQNGHGIYTLFGTHYRYFLVNEYTSWIYWSQKVSLNLINLLVKMLETSFKLDDNLIQSS